MSTGTDTAQLNPECAALARFQDLFLVLGDLIKRVADTDDPAIRHKRADVRAKLVELERDTSIISRAALEIRCRTVSASEPRRGHSWEHPALAALTGAAVALTFLSAPERSFR